MHVSEKAASSRSPVRQEQARLFALLARDLILAHQRWPAMELDDFVRLPEYERLLLAGYACGFVCHDLAHMDGELFEHMKTRPRDRLASCSFGPLRRWVHTLFRAERWNHGFGSHIREAIESGALEMVASRLERDHRLMRPEVEIISEAAPPTCHEDSLEH